MKFVFLKIRWVFILALLLGNFFVWYYIFQFYNRDLEVTFLDVGQGDAILIRAPGGRTMLIDGGPGKNILSRVAEQLPLFSREIDLLMESHPDTDHVGGLPDVLSRYSVRGIIKPCIASGNPYSQALDSLSKERGVPEICAENGQIIDLGRGVKIKILHTASGKISDTNSASIVAVLTYDKNKFLFTGDTTSAVEKYLTYTEGGKLQSDVYKVSHHGSRLSNDEKFLKMVKPEISVVSVGKNSYGHPSIEVLDNLVSLESVVLRTDQLGTIKLSSDGDNISRQ
jgi:competence protein ComEC